MDYDYDEYEDLYADELELADELHTEPHLPTKRVISGRDDVIDSDTPRSASSAKRTSDQISGSSPQATASPTLESIRKRLKLNDTSGEDTLPEPCSPRDLVIDEEEEQRTTGSLQGEEPLLPTSQDAAEDTPELLQAASSEDFEMFSYSLSVGLRDKGGRLKFVGLRNENWAEEVEELRSASRHRGNLLSRPFWDIWLEAQAELERKRAELDKPDSIVKSHATELLPEGMNAGDVSGSTDHGTPLVPAALWVDKYRPRNFIELLSDDGVNRTLLQWLKLWDTVVFGRPHKTKLHQEKQQNANNFVKKYLPELNEELDEHKRPQQKVVLLHGPPGLGKTTLAHVIATHAGYNVVELNASDDRSPEVFKNALEAATQMRAVLGQDPRPNCLVIDEIDGAPAASINVLVSMIKCTGQSAGGGKKKSKKEGSLLLRPVVCICNELYVPALRPLRQIAFTLHFPATHKTRLATRLQEIMRRERMKGDTAAVLALCDKAGNDVRSCLSTLQFVQSRKHQLTVTDVQTFNVGQKDVQRGLLSILQEIFQKRRNMRKTHLYGSNSSTDGNAEELRMESVVHSAQAFGDYEKLMQALFDNYVHVNFKDPRFEIIQRAPEWLCFADELLNVVHRLQNYSLYPYLPYMAPAFHASFSVVPYTKMVFQNSFLEARGKQTQLSNILTALFAETTAQIRCHLTGNRVVLDVLPWLLCIIQPTIRPVNTQLFSTQEKQQFHQLISVMAAFNLTYQQARTADGVYQYALEPNIEELTKFPGISSQQPLTYATKQLIARELELEKMRKSDVTDAGGVAQKFLRAPVVSKSWTPPAKPTAKIAEEPVRVAVDFFGRVIQKPSQAATSGCSVGSATSSGIWYQFKEGFSNAVRRTIRIKDLL